MWLLSTFADNFMLALKPGTIKTGMSKGKSLKLYYKMALIPLILSLALATIIFYSSQASISSSTIPFLSPSIQTALSSTVSSLSGSGSGSTGSSFIMLITNLSIIAARFLIALPLAILINAGILHLFGKKIFGVFNNNYATTLSATVYSFIPILLFGWLISFFPALNPLFILLIIWSMIIYAFALSSLQSITKKRALVVIILTGLAVTVVALVILPFAVSFINSLLLPALTQNMYGGIW